MYVWAYGIGLHSASWQESPTSQGIPKMRGLGQGYLSKVLPYHS
jgi:hypothetical protein